MRLSEFLFAFCSEMSNLHALDSEVDRVLLSYRVHIKRLVRTGNKV